jgi:hypothetical protein
MKPSLAKPFHVPSCMSVPMFRDSADDPNHESKYGEALVILQFVRVFCIRLTCID